MKRALLIAASLLLACQSAHAEGWVYYFYINGDFSFMGPDYADGSVRLSDHARKLYDQVEALAIDDRINSYVVFYDPKGGGGRRSGSGYGFWNEYVRFHVYDRGKLVNSDDRAPEAERFFEIDATRPENFEAMVGESLRYLGPDVITARKLFYFYGEHVPLVRSATYDLSHPDSPFDLDLFLGDGLSHFKAIGGIDLLIAHSCYNGTVSFLRRARKIARHVIFGQIRDRSGIPNAPLELREALLDRGDDDVQGLVDALVAANPFQKPYPFQLMAFGPDYRELIDRIDRLERSIGQGPSGAERVAEYDRRVVLDALESMDPAGGEEIRGNTVVLPRTREIIVPLLDYVQGLRQAGADPAAREEFYRYIRSHPEYSALHEVLHPLSSHSP